MKIDLSPQRFYVCNREHYHSTPAPVACLCCIRIGLILFQSHELWPLAQPARFLRAPKPIGRARAATASGASNPTTVVVINYFQCARIRALLCYTNTPRRHFSNAGPIKSRVRCVGALFFFLSCEHSIVCWCHTIHIRKRRRRQCATCTRTKARACFLYPVACDV